MKYQKGNRASICEWNLSFTFLCKEQVQKFSELLLNDEIDYHFEILKNDDEKYECHIHDMVWANNLTRVAELLEQVDYKMD